MDSGYLSSCAVSEAGAVDCWGGRLLATQPPEQISAGTVAVGRIVVRWLADGRAEFGFRITRGERVLPTRRFFPADARVGEWLFTTTVEQGRYTLGRIGARKLNDGRIEFGFVTHDSRLILSEWRSLATDTTVGHWLWGSEIELRVD